MLRSVFTKSASNFFATSRTALFNSTRSTFVNPTASIKTKWLTKIPIQKSISVRSFSNGAILKQVQNTAKNGQAKNLLNSSKWVGYWLVGTSGLVFGIVVLGGLTRLTESGLSITEWKPVTGTIPPLNQKEWEEEFAKYKESPEFKQLNSHISLDEFKFIFFMEWVHRLWGRAIGAIFVLPAIYFATAKKSSPHVNRRLFGLACLLGLQGFIGWWMVKSGLDQEQLDERKSKPTVSQYRLTTHLGAAFLLYMGMLWTGLEILRESKWVKDPNYALKLFSKLDNPALKPLRGLSLGLLGLTFATAMTGGLVAGLDAGLIYNTFPHMGDDWIPSKRELMDKNFARKKDQSDLIWRNMLENPTTVQLNHRIFATSTFFAVLAVHMYCNKRKNLIPRNALKSMHSMMGIVTLQLGLGIATLIYLVPVSLASLHQAGAIALLTNALVFASQLRKPRVPMRILIGGLFSKQQTQNGSKILSAASKLAK
ncbi:LAFE_0H11254g1_1 [Lachancea fermentati]|uniref:LAFE_0H11254g1_1 n=1 Tax=Lachancea fermentati TaxID=4955 RepID=A0A1G4MKB5_LACFM|nr:LAFE_0H11254g1_1 [Lachancea fermentati]